MREEKSIIFNFTKFQYKIKKFKIGFKYSIILI
jgi:hypothetical protein